MTRLLLPLLLAGAPVAMAAPPEPTPLVLVEAAPFELEVAAEEAKADKPKKAPGKRFELRLPWWAWLSIVVGGLLLIGLTCLLCGLVPVAAPIPE